MERLIISGKGKFSDEDQEESKDEALSYIQAFNPDQENPHFMRLTQKYLRLSSRNTECRLLLTLIIDHQWTLQRNKNCQNHNLKNMKKR